MSMSGASGLRRRCGRVDPLTVVCSRGRWRALSFFPISSFDCLGCFRTFEAGIVLFFGPLDAVWSGLVSLNLSRSSLEKSMHVSITAWFSSFDIRWANSDSLGPCFFSNSASSASSCWDSTTSDSIISLVKCFDTYGLTHGLQQQRYVLRTYVAVALPVSNPSVTLSLTVGSIATVPTSGASGVCFAFAINGTNRYPSPHGFHYNLLCPSSYSVVNLSGMSPRLQPRIGKWADRDVPVLSFLALSHITRFQTNRKAVTATILN